MGGSAIRVGIVGYGFAGHGFHAYLVGRVPDLALAAVASRDPERRARAERDHGVATFETLDGMLARADVDLVIVATPHHTHAPLAIRAMDAGKHAVVDKVMCMNATEADEMIAASHRNGVLLSIFQNRRWDWDYLTVKRVLTDDLIGPPYLFESAILRYRRPGGWRGTAEASGGILYDWGAHFIDQALQLVPGRVASVTCDVQYRGWGDEIGSYARLHMRFESGVLFGIELSNLARFERPRWLVLGERGSLVKYGLDPQERAMLAGNIDGAVEEPGHRAKVSTELHGLATEMTIDSIKGDWTAYYRNVADAILGRRELIVRPQEARRAMAVFDGAMESAKAGQTIRLDV